MGPTRSTCKASRWPSGCRFQLQITRTQLWVLLEVEFRSWLYGPSLHRPFIIILHHLDMTNNVDHLLIAAWNHVGTYVGKVPSDWKQSFIVCLYKEKGDALERGNYHSLKLTEQVMKVLERIVDGLIRQLVSIEDSLFGFVPGRGTTDAIFVVRQLQQETLHGFCRPGEGFWLSISEGHLVGTEKTWCGGVDCTTGAGDVCKCAEPCPCWWGVQWRVWS